MHGMGGNEAYLDRARQLTIEQKAALCLGGDIWHTASVPEHGIGPITLSDGPHGLRRQAEGGDNIGIGGSLPATCFPTACALASSWNPELAREIGDALGVEARAQDVAVVLGPGVNIKRSPLCGRNFEYLSEDPYLAGRLGAALVRGIQAHGVGTSMKHFAANNQETDRMRVSAEVDERTLREIYLPAFEHIVTAATPWTVMCAYNKINGTYASEHHWLLTELLRDEWGFDGLVMSDWGAVHDRVASVAAGLDLEMPPDLGHSDKALVEAVQEGRLDEGLLDLAAARVLQLVDRAAARIPAEVDVDAHHALARRAAAECIVLLRNEGGALPLAGRGTVAVLGELARTPRYQGAGSSQVNPTRVDVALDALTAALPGATVRFAPGYPLDDPTAAPDQELIAEAVRVARDADVVVACIGLPAVAESEGYDRTHMDLPPAQLALLDALAVEAPGVPVVAVLFNGSAVRTSSWDDRTAAVVECWLGGQAGGSAVADVLTGAVNPSGKLAETIPLTLADCSASLNFPGEDGRVRYGEGVFVGYRGYDASERAVAYPFGHGLSYTTFDYDGLSVTRTGSVDAGDLAVTVSCRVRNTGDRAGREIVQLYLGDPQASVARPPRELKGFGSLTLEPGAEGQVEFTLGPREFAFWSARDGRWLVEAGEFTVQVGASSRDIRLTESVTIEASPPDRPLTGMSTLEEWLADPAGERALRAAIGTNADGTPAGILSNPQMQRMLGNFPVSTLAAFAEFGLSHEIVDRLVAERA
jgi:beta-glucosidase